MRVPADRLRLSPYVLPQVRMGLATLSPVNLTLGAQRLRYLEGLHAHVNGLLDEVEAGRRSLGEVRAFTRQAPFFDALAMFTNVDGRLRCVPQRDSMDSLSFEPERLRLLFADGRRRGLPQFAMLETGEQTYRFAGLFPTLVEGTTDKAFRRLCDKLELDLSQALPELLRGGILEVSTDAGEQMLERFRATPTDRLTWLGHAFVVFQSGPTTIWIDPRMFPRLSFRAAEVRKLFSPTMADARLVPGHGPKALQLLLRHLPRPDAVCITHQDSDHFDPGLLMCLPDSTPIIVPRHQEGAGWDVDLPQVLRTLLGPRRKVIALGHHQHLDVGAVRIHAIPFRNEMPDSLPHQWNCYLLTTRRTAVAALADSAVGGEHVEAIAQRARGRRLLVLSAPALYAKKLHGYREVPTLMHNPLRTWSWFQNVSELFDPVSSSGLHMETLAQLARKVNRPYFFPYARGSTPWFRFEDADGVFSGGIGSCSLKEFQGFARAVARLRVGAKLPWLRYGVPFTLG